MAMQQREMVESLLRHGCTKKCLSRLRHAVQLHGDWQGEIQSQQVQNFWQHLRPDFVVLERLNDVTDACNDNWRVR